MVPGVVDLLTGGESVVGLPFELERKVVEVDVSPAPLLTLLVVGPVCVL